MNINDIDITLNIRNNTNYPQEINIMGSPVNLLDNSNATRQFLWNITPENIQNQNQINISLDYKGNNQITYTTYTAIFYNTVLGDVNTALNGIVSQINLLGIGNFFGYVELGQVYISTYNNDYEFNTLTLNTSTFAGQLNTTFTTNGGTGFDNVVDTLALQSDGKIVVGGSFTTYNGNSCNYIARLNANGTFDNTFLIGTGFDVFVTSLIIQQDGKIIVGGSFNTYQGDPFIGKGICRLNADGLIDYGFIVGNGFSGAFIPVQTIKLQSDGKIIVGGNFGLYDVNPCNCICRLNSDGTFDNTFNIGSGFDNVVFALFIQSDDKIIVGGSFLNFNGNPCNGICRLNSDGTFDNTFNIGSGFDNNVSEIKIYQNKIYVSGSFNTYDGNPVNKMVRLNLDGTYDNTFVPPSLNSFVFTFDFQDNSKIIAGGGFNLPTSYIIRLNSDGSYDNTFVVNFTGAAAVYTIINLNNLVYIGGGFVSYEGFPTNNIAQLYNQVPF